MSLQEWTARVLAKKLQEQDITQPEITQPVTLVDVREPWEQDICLIPNSRKIPLSQLPEYLEELATLSGPVVFICHHGIRSLNAASQLGAAGKDGISLKGGVAAWAALVDTTMATY